MKKYFVFWVLRQAITGIAQNTFDVQKRPPGRISDFIGWIDIYLIQSMGI